MKALKNRINIKNTCLSIIILVLVIKIFTTFNIYINADEPFTMDMMTHSFLHIFKIDLLDVHPPLYYLMLKTFLAIFTFWTNSITVKILFAKIFSLICYVIIFCFFIKILKLINIDVDFKMVLIAYLLVPNVIIYSFQIRMYELTAMFLTFELYELMKFSKTNKYSNLYLSLFGALLASYTHYFGAVSAGAFLFTYFIKYILDRNKSKTIKMFLLGVAFLILFLPCITFAYKQFSYVMSNGYSNLMSSSLGNNFIVQVITTLIGFMNISNLISLLFGVIILIISLCFIHYSITHFSFQFNSILFIVIITLIISIIVPTFISLFGKSMFQARYLYPIASIYLFFLAVIGVKVLESHSNFIKIMMIVLIFLLLLINIKNLKDNANGDIRAQRSFNIARIWNNEDKRTIHINCHDSGNETDLLIKQSVYSKYMEHHPKLYVSHLHVGQVLGSNNRKLLHKNFNNIYLIGKSN